MRNFLIVITCMLCLGGIATLYQHYVVKQFQSTMPKSTRENFISLDQKVEYIPNKPQFEQPITDLAVTPSANHMPKVINYSILPDYPETMHTKEFLKKIHALGSIGTHSVFQNNILHLNTQQLLANLMLRKDEAAYLDTVSLAPNMLSDTQVVNCYNAAISLIQDLKKMSDKCSCSSAQREAINVAVGRLTYLTIQLHKEIASIQILSLEASPKETPKE